MAFVEFEKVSKIYHTGAVEIPALRDATFQVEKGEICVIVGASGAGKTTLLNILGGMDTLTGGTVKLDGRDISRYDRRQLTEYRRRDVGFVFQFYNLIQNLTALENVEIAAQLCPHPLDAAEVLREVGLGERMKNFPAQLSGGEQQRVAIARALAKNPQAAAVRRAHRCAGLCYRQEHSEAAAGYLPPDGNDGGHHHPQLRSDGHGGSGHLHQERHHPVRAEERTRHPCGRDRVVRICC